MEGFTITNLSMKTALVFVNPLNLQFKCELLLKIVEKLRKRESYTEYSIHKIIVFFIIICATNFDYAFALFWGDFK